MFELIELNNTLILCGAFFRVTFKRSSTVMLGLFNNGVEHFLVGVKLYLLLLPLFGVVGVIADGTGDWKEIKGREEGGKERRGVGGGGGGGGIEGSDDDDVGNDGSGGGGGGGGSDGGGGCTNDVNSAVCFNWSTNEDGGGDEGGTGGTEEDGEHEAAGEIRRADFTRISSSASFNFFSSCINVILFSFILLPTSRTLSTSAVKVPRIASILVCICNANRNFFFLPGS